MVKLEQKLKNWKKTFSDTSDLGTRLLTMNNGKKFALIFIDNVVDPLILTEGVISPLQKMKLPKTTTKDIATIASESLIEYIKVETEDKKDEIIKSILNGFCAILFEDSKQVLLVECSKWIKRLPSEPPTSAVIEGPREGFVEDIITNLTLIRKRLKSEKLKIESLQIGKYTSSEIRICYLEGICSPQIVQEIKEKLNKIKIDGIVDSNYLVEFLKPSKYTVFKHIGTTEKPDITVAKILEGRVAILIDGSPIVLTLPYILLEDLQSSNDYYTTPAHATFLRWMRFCAGIIAILLPGIYISLVLYHFKVVPIKFLISITNLIQGIPLAPLLEVLFIIFLFEMLYEASLRMPRYVGLALSVVGALILGDTAVKAGLISPPAVLIVAVTGVLSYTIPQQSSQISFLRLVFTLVGGVLGIYGIILASMFLIGYLSSINYYGSSYLAPFAPHISQDKKDALQRKPISEMFNRPRSIPNKNSRRLKKNEGNDK